VVAVSFSRLGLLLQPDVDLDGDLLGTVLPRRGAVAPLAAVPGRGYLVVDGRPGLVQVAAPANMDP
jgi:S-DNA-T family DNA segregation ATPase FtsK/SpoIIIE